MFNSSTGGAMRAFAKFLLIVAALCGISFEAFAAYPDHPIHIIVPFPAGGSTDILFRAMQADLAKQLGQSVVIEDRGGGAATIGMNLVAHAAPDGYTLGVATLSFAANPPFLANGVPYDPAKDFAPVSLVAKLPLVLTVNTSVPARSVKELVALAKREPGVLNYGSTGIASSGHLGGALFESLAGVQMTHVPYSSVNVVASVAAGQVQVLVGPIPSSMPFIRSGKLIPLGVTSMTRVSALPDVPTIAQAGVPGFDMFEFSGVVAPAGTPPKVIARIQKAIVAALKDPKLHKIFETAGAEPVGSTPAQFHSFLQGEFTKWAKIAAEVHSRDAAKHK
jgi:tripartite-type tricarboxylate transporter receptor subunit TctC